MVEALSGAVIGEILKKALETIKNGRNFGSTLETSIDILNALEPLVEELKGYNDNDSLDRPRKEIERLETLVTELKELVGKSKNLTRWNLTSFPRYQEKLEKQIRT